MIEQTPNSPEHGPNADSGAELHGRPSISFSSFRQVAQSVADALEIPIAICKRPSEAPGSSANPFQNRPLLDAVRDKYDILEIVFPSVEIDVKRYCENIKPKVIKALKEIPGGEALDRYFAISTGEPEQDPEEAKKSLELIERLRDANSDPSSLLKDICDHATSSEVDPDALRALMYGHEKANDKSSEPEANEDDNN